MADILQFILSGITIGAIYALVAIGFSMIYSASEVVNFAQGEFVMVGGMATVSLSAGGLPLWLAAAGAILLAGLAGLLLERLAVRQTRGAAMITVIIVTIGASITLRGLAQVVWDRNYHSLPPFSGAEPILLLGASILPQTLWVIGVTLVLVAGLHLFLTRTLFGKAIRATAINRMASELVGIDVKRVMAVSYGLSAGLGAIAGILITPIALTHFEGGVLLGLKGFAAAILGGLGSLPGAVIGGLLLGLSESLAAGYLSSAYKGGIAFLILIAVLLLRPSGLLGTRSSARV